MDDELNEPISMSGGSQSDDELSDVTLLIQMARGDQQALQQLYARCRDKKSITLYRLPPGSNEWQSGESQQR